MASQCMRCTISIFTHKKSTKCLLKVAPVLPREEKACPYQQISLQKRKKNCSYQQMSLWKKKLKPDQTKPRIISSYNDRIRPLLDVVNRLRHLKITPEGIQLPTIVVVGDQLTGKSSVPSQVLACPVAKAFVPGSLS